MNTFFMSEGLDVNFGDETKINTEILVNFGNIAGTLVSITTGSLVRLEFITTDVGIALMSTVSPVNNFKLQFDNKIYEYTLETYNYTLMPHDKGLLVVVEEYTSEKE